MTGCTRERKFQHVHTHMSGNTPSCCKRVQLLLDNSLKSSLGVMEGTAAWILWRSMRSNTRPHARTEHVCSHAHAHKLLHALTATHSPSSVRTSPAFSQCRRARSTRTCRSDASPPIPTRLRTAVQNQNLHQHHHCRATGCCPKAVC